MNTNNKFFNQQQSCQFDNNNFIEEGMPSTTFYHNDNNTYYQEEDDLEDEFEQEQQQQKSTIKGDGNVFRPTFYNPFEIKHRRRTSRAQFKVLEKTFSENPKPNAAIRRWLAQKLVMTPRGVQVWFQNRRAKEKTVNSKKVSAPAQESTTKAPIITTESTLSLSLPSPSSSSVSSIDVLSNTMEKQPMMNDIISPVLSSSIHLVCTCNDCCNSYNGTPMTRTVSYPPVQQQFYHSDTCSTSNADEEELLMTPISPFVDSTQVQQQQQLYDYPISMNNTKKFYNQPSQAQDYNNQWSIAAATAEQQEHAYFNQQQHVALRNNMMFDDHRRYSQPAALPIVDENRFSQSQEVSLYWQ
jgi:hypothetical protein